MSEPTLVEDIAGHACGDGRFLVGDNLARLVICEVADALEDPTNGLLVISSHDCTSGTQYATKVKFALVNWLREQAKEKS